MLVTPLFFLAVKKFSNKPADQGKEEWKTVTMTEIDRVLDRLRRVQKTKIPFVYTGGLAVLATLLTFFLCFNALKNGSPARAFIILDLYLIFAPVLYFARIKKWYPTELAGKLAAYQPVFSYNFPDKVKLSPSLRFDEDENGKKIPEDLRVTIRPSVCPPDFLGAQFHLAYNTGPNGKVPYMYAVFICKGEGTSWHSFKKMRFDKFITETSAEKTSEYSTVVLRLDTKCRSDGYHTKPADIARLISNTNSALISV